MDHTKRGVEQALTSLWSRVLRRNDFGVDDNFFDVGGTSLSLVELHREILDTVCDGVELIDMMTYPSVKKLAEFIVGRKADAPASAQLGARK
jgi:hypothetical protein